MKDKTSANKGTKRGISSVNSGGLLTQLISITDLTLRNSKTTSEQKEALALKEILEQHAQKAA